MNKDYLSKYLVLDKQARMITVFNTEVMNEYVSNIHSSPVCTAAMGRLITSTLLMGSTLKGQEKVLVSIDGKGPIGVIRAEADAFGNVRGYATNPYVDLPLNEYQHLDVPSAVGTNGFLYVRKQLNMKEPFIGSCELVSGEIGEDISYYYGTSEQTPTIVALGVLVDKDQTCKISGGFMIQLLPHASEEAYGKLDEILHNLKSVSSLLLEVNGDADKLVDSLFDDKDFLFSNDVKMKCTCSREKTMMFLTQLTEKEIEEEIDKNEGLDVTCNFCQKKYHFTTDDLKLVKENKKNGLYKVK